MKKVAVTLAVALALSTFARAEAQGMIGQILEGMTKKPRTIETQGTATVKIVPDEVIIKFGITSQHDDLNKASSANNERVKDLLAFVKKSGVAAEDTQTSSIAVTTLRRSSSMSDSTKVIGYRVDRNVILDVKDLSKVESLLNDCLKNGANEIRDMQFQSTQLRKYRDQARTEAAKAAHEKADLLAQALSATVGKVQTIKEVVTPDFYPSNTRMLAQNYNSMSSLGDSEGAAMTGTFAPGMMEAKATVDVIWELE